MQNTTKVEKHNSKDTSEMFERNNVLHFQESVQSICVGFRLGASASMKFNYNALDLLIQRIDI